MAKGKAKPKIPSAAMAGAKGTTSGSKAAMKKAMSATRRPGKSGGY
jgi:hypothetical protein